MMWLLTTGGGDCKVAKMLLQEHASTVEAINIIDIDAMVTQAGNVHERPTVAQRVL